MNYRTIKELKDKLFFEIEGLKMLEGNFNNDIIKEKRKQYNFYVNLLKCISK